MTRSRSGGGGSPHAIPASLPADGTPYTVVTTTTHQKKLGDSPMNHQPEPQSLSQADFEDAHWNVYIQTSKGFEFAEKLKGKPYDADIRDLFGPGVYRSTPVGPDGRPVTSMTVTHKVLDPTEAMSTKSVSKSNGVADIDSSQWKGEEQMPAWMRYQLQHAAEERSEARRRAEEAELRKEDWERQQRDREWQKMEREAREERERREAEAIERRERYEREERERKERDERERLYREEKEEREREERKHRGDQFTAMMAAATTVVTSFLESKNSRDNSHGKDLNEMLLQAIISDKKSSSSTSMADQIEILLALDQLRKNDAPAPVEKEDDGSDIMKMLAGAAPLLAAMKGGGGQAPAPAMNGGYAPPALSQQPDPHALAAQALQDPALVSQLAMQNPTGVAASLVQAVKGNPLLKNAVVKAFEESGE